MEMHHKLRRDPSWHPSACNICGQMGHQAAQCTSGTVNWRQIYGDKAFILRGPVYWSDELARKKLKVVDAADLERRAKEYAKGQAEKAGMNFEEILKNAEVLNAQDPALTIKQAPAPVEEEPLPAGWGMTLDPTTSKPYYWHKKTQKTMWERPTAETPIN
ncbi:hypothetical protein CEUSTIGMA_g94.t1 [Chlamydomonas eustigma]|uniref:WW domain-containing protein n=1 Tax=Chlamydomonas eustigma TaxID=1157962 RepID=A0A250WP83_9CHLO|nr:hypothetical protein CEUSTIGMA_g94.t1 [Chlamydomonas eustigma]|eukprot:GAX72638.1 hypothetical protein CEUSTIGMA_g94.t1 [Chlamydomonas eustigma]